MKKKLFYIFSSIASSFFFLPVFADVNVESLIGDIKDFWLPDVNTDASKWAGIALAELIKYGIGLAWILAIIACTWAAIQMFLAVGDDKKFEDAKKLLIHALIGVAIAGGAYAIVSLISGISL